MTSLEIHRESVCHLFGRNLMGFTGNVTDKQVKGANLEQSLAMSFILWHPVSCSFNQEVPGEILMHNRPTCSLSPACL